MNYDNNHKNGSSSKKKNKKDKRILLLKNPFSDSESSTTRKHKQKNLHNYFFSSSEPGSPSAFDLLKQNPFSDSRVLPNGFLGSFGDLGNGNEEDDNDDEEDEERTVQARRDTLAALDPYSHESINAEFKSLKVPVQPTEETAEEGESLTDLEPMELVSDEILDLYAQDKFIQDSIVSEVCTPRSSFNDKNISDRNSVNPTPRMMTLYGEHVPDIAISFATPSPPLKPTHHRRGSSIARNAGLLSASFTPSPLSLTSEESSLLHDSESDGISSLGFIKGPSRRSSTVYKPFFSRITGPSVTSASTAESTSNMDQGEGNGETEDHIGVEINKSEGPGSRRNTFGAPVQPRFTVQQGQFIPHHQDQKDQVQVPRPLVPKRPSTKRRKQGGRRGNLDPWDSCDDMLIQATDDEDVPFFGSSISSDLKGKIGRCRRNEDEGVDSTTTGDPNLLSSRFGRGVVDDWIIHPRTAAIRGTYSKVHDTIPVPKSSDQQAKSPRPLSSLSDYTTISLASPPMTNRGATGLSRADSLDSSFYRLKRGAASLLMGFGPQSDFSRGLEKKSQDLEGDDQMQRMMSGHGNYNQDNHADQRSSSMTFGPRKTVTPPLANFSSFSSFQSLLSNPKPSSNNSPPPFSPNTYLRRAQTTAFAGSYLGTSSGSRVSFSPISNRKTPAMIPTIVIPPTLQHERSALTATTVSFAPSSGYSDATMTLAFDDDEQYRPTRRFEDQDAYSKSMESPTLTIQSASSSATFQRLLPQRDDLLKVPEPKAAARKEANQPTSLAASAMAAAQRARSQGLTRNGSTGSNASADFTQDDYIGQFERERARARGDPATAMSSFGSLATTMHSSLSAGSSNSTLHYSNSSGMMHNAPKRLEAYVKERTSFGFGFMNGPRRERQESNQSDVIEKLMHLPEPSPFEGMCSCRGIFNISSMLLILLGLVLLILGYPIASSLKKERMEAEAAAASLAAATDAALKAKMNSTSVHFAKFNMDNNNNASVALPGVLGGLSGIGRGDALVDPETPLEKRSKTAYDGTQWSLVFSDEFNQEGRSFGPGQDSHWEAIDLAPSTGSLEGYKQDAVRTKGGRLEITLDRTPVPAGKQRKRNNQQGSWMFTSGMLQSWNKMCIQGGLVEVAVSLPGNPSLPGLKPRVFLLGNLARYGYRASMDGVYPYSYSKCDESSMNSTASTDEAVINKQRLSACSNIQGGVGIGRGAPEISLLETHYGILTEPSAVEAQKQVIQQQRLPSSSLRKRQLQERSTVIIEKQRLGTSRVSMGGSSVNSVDSGKVQSIAISSVKVASPLTNDSSVVSSSTPQWIQPLDNNVFESMEPVDSLYVKVGVEYSPGSLSQVSVETKETAPTAYAQFQMNDQWQDGPLLNQADYQLVSAEGGSDRWRSAKSLGSGQMIPQEPMSMVLSLGLLQDEIMMHPDLVFPAVMKIDYVRVYHPDATGTRSMSCDPVDHPTAEYIRNHPRAYQESTLQTWAEAGYA